MLAALALAALTTSAFAQQQSGPNPEFLQHALEAVAAQRNDAMNAQAVLQAQLTQARADLAKAQARIKELETAKTDQPKQ